VKETAEQVEIYSDTICPWCYVGKRRFEAALAGLPGPAPCIRWMPFQLNPHMDPQGMAREAYLVDKFGGAEHAREVYAPIEAAGREEGIAFDFDAIARTPNTLDSHRLIHYAHGQPQGQDGVVEALFDSYFVRGEDIGDRDVLARAAAGAGLDADTVRAYLAGEDDAPQVRDQDAMARRMGIQGVPFFVIGRRYAVSGAQHAGVFAAVFERLAAQSR